MLSLFEDISTHYGNVDLFYAISVKDFPEISEEFAVRAVSILMVSLLFITSLLILNIFSPLSCRPPPPSRFKGGEAIGRVIGAKRGPLFVSILNVLFLLSSIWNLHPGSH